MKPEEIFLAAIEKSSPSERAAYLAGACGNDVALRAQLEALLKAHDGAGSFLEQSLLDPAAMTREQPAVIERPGVAIGPYKLLEQIGEGGFGVVFMAEQTQPVRRKVALKVLKPGMDTRQVIARFEAERQALALMDHPNIAHVLDGGETASGRPYFVMELVRGISIAEFCDQSHLTVRQRLALFAVVCQAVQHAHQKGIIHRDIKPSNVMVTLHDARPVVKVIDFGIAKATGQQLTDKTLFTNFAQMIGTPMYMSPEQAQMSGLDIDTRTDIYSLGVLLYELLTGTTPFDQERLRQAAYDEMRRIIREEEPARPSTRMATLGQAATTVAANRGTDPKRLSQMVRGELDWIVMKALEKERQRRFESASALAADVERYLRDEPVQACPPSALYRFRKYARRHKAALGMAAVMAVAVVLTISSLAGAVHVLAASIAEIKEEQKQTKAANDKLLLAVDREQQTLAYQRIALAERELAANNVGRAEELLAECPAALRGWEWHFLKRLPHEEPQVTKAGTTWVGALACSADGRHFATASFGTLFLGELKVWAAAGGQAVHTLRGHFGPATCLAFAPDSRRLASGGVDRTVIVWDLATGQMRCRLTHGGFVWSLAYSPDGRVLATASQDGMIKLWNPDTGAEVSAWRGHDAQATCIAFSPDGQRLVSYGLDSQIRVWDALTGHEQQRIDSDGGRVFSLRFRKDGRHVVTAGVDGLRLWDLHTGGEKWAVKGNNSSSLNAVFSPDGQRIVCAGWDKTVKVLDWRTGQEVLALRGHSDLVSAVAFSGDGWLLVSASLDGTVRLWKASPLSDESQGHLRRLQGHQGHVLGLSFSSDGRWLATASTDGTAKVWDVDSGQPVHSLAARSDMVTSVAFHSGDQRLTTVTALGGVVDWDAASGSRRQSLQVALGTFLNAGFNIAYSGNGRIFAALDKDGAVGVWETASGREIAKVPAAIPPYLTVFLSPDGQRLSAAALGRIVVVDVASGKTVAVLSGLSHIVHSLTFSNDGRQVAAAGWDGTARIWDFPKGKLLHTFRHDDRVTCVAFRGDGRQLASGSCDNTARVWDLQTGKAIATLRGNIGYVMAVAYSSDGKLLATASGNRTEGEVRIWDTAVLDRNR